MYGLDGTHYKEMNALERIHSDNHVLLTNDHFFISSDGNLFVTDILLGDDKYRGLYSSSSSNLLSIGRKSEHDFVVCEKYENSTYDDPATYLFDNKAMQFYAYDHKQNNLNLINNISLHMPHRIRKIVKCVNSHNLVYYWCLMHNGVIFKIVFDHQFYSHYQPQQARLQRRQQQQRTIWRRHHKHFISEYGPFEYEEQILCGKHSLDLEVFRLCPTIRPRFVDLTSSGDHILLVDADRRLWVYGNNRVSQCGIKPSTDIIIQPIRNQALKHVIVDRIHAAKNKSVVIDNHGQCLLFGTDISNISFRKPFTTFQRYPGLQNTIIKLANCSQHHFVFVDEHDTIYGLGSNKFAQIAPFNADMSNTYYSSPHKMSLQRITANALKNEKVSHIIIDGHKNYFITTRTVKC
eukprot:CAMPEP_0202705652 /NCGR_PEP_ID=MMETSP1385-20130828/18169_1 /ASSEMBLY_ACC=CAM_ASM_000861 /TAXON_ID=933848 /ORGANISM="Elphidium margaritaceum" /LENGTH=405 /DNA_ID=CAMNT_0049363935 /DNA_START=251 /DNA_END=1468 /DNA_ORIENTATION=+